jgi:toxin ParE1/3/4
MRNIEWALSAISDVKRLREFIARDSLPYAERFVQRLIEVIENTSSYPMMGRKMPEALDDNVREIMFQKYRIVYRVETSRILILMVIHGSRDLAQVDAKPWEVL